MRIAIDNLDGLGAVDYSGGVAAEGLLTVQRGLNVPSRCTVEILVGVGGLAMPVRKARVVVSAEDATILFTGYVATEPVRVYVGEGLSGAAYRVRVTAVSDEWLLDKVGSGAAGVGGMSVQMTGRALLERLVGRAGSALSVASGVEGAMTGGFLVKPAEPWSVNAGLAASAAYAGYRAVGGAIVFQPATSVTHAVSDAAGTLSIAELQTGAVRELANDVTVSGAEEPTAYVQESFAGDGTTTVFELSGAAFRGTNRTLAGDSFEEAVFDATQWVASDPASCLSLTSAGLTMNGGTGADGVTTLTALDAVEMGGSVVVEMGGVVLGAASDGMLGGMYEGVVELANCFAGFRVRQSASGAGGVTTLVPVLHGEEVGTAYTPLAGHKYTLRMRLHCVEMQRVMQPYYCMVDGAVEQFGSASGQSAPMDVVFELVDEGIASNTPATVLFDSAATVGLVAETPAACFFAVVNAAQMYGSMGSVSVTRPGSMWAESTLPSGVVQTRLMGLAGQGCDCAVTYGTPAGTPGKVTFFAGRVPVPGERVTVSYRSSQRSVARLQDAASVAEEAAGGASGTCRWLGKVLEPIARSSVDCESAASAVLAMATARTAAVAGTYSMVNPAVDVWPGDVLTVTSEGVTSDFLVRKVVVEDGGAVPEVQTYKIAFANDWATDWADGLGMKLSEEIAADVILPQTALSSAGQVLANLQQMSLTSVTTTALQVDAGTAPPAGGGFEVRRKDWRFGEGVDAADLVLRSPVRGFSIPRATQVEQYFVRMYDASSPPVYSRFSSVVAVNWPMS